MLLARDGCQQDAAVDVAAADARLEGGAVLQHHLLQAAEADGDGREVAAILFPQHAEVPRHGRQQLQIDQFERHAARPQATDVGERAGQIARHGEAGDDGDILDLGKGAAGGVDIGRGIRFTS